MAYAFGICYDMCVATERTVKLFRNGRNQAVRIPRDLELPGREALIRKEGETLVLVPKRTRSLLATLKRLQTIAEAYPTIEDMPPEEFDL